MLRHHTVESAGKLPLILTISASDPTGGAGMAADIRVCSRLGTYPLPVITAVTAQNNLGVHGIYDIPGDFLLRQLRDVLAVCSPDAVKIGLVTHPESVHVIADLCNEYNLTNIVIDPVGAPTAGGKLMSDPDSTFLSMIEELFPLASLITPNHAEDVKLRSLKSDPYGLTPVLLKGGDSDSRDCTDLLLINHNLIKEYNNHRIDSRNLHGTGCVLSSAIASYLGHCFPLEEAIGKAKIFLTNSLKASVGYSLMGDYGPSFII